MDIVTYPQRKSWKLVPKVKKKMNNFFLKELKKILEPMKRAKYKLKFKRNNLS